MRVSNSLPDELLSESTRRKLLNVLLFQIGWFVCVLAGGTAALLVTALFLLLHHLLVVQNAREWSLILGVAAAGIVADSLLQFAGVFHFPESWPFIPLWLCCLWLLFATTLCHALAWLRGRWWLAALLAAISGPASYYAGGEFGAAELARPLWFSLGSLALFWAVFFPLSQGASLRLKEG